MRRDRPLEVLRSKSHKQASRSRLDPARVTTASPPRSRSHALARKQREKWLTINTAIYWHIEQSLDFSGPERARDLRTLDRLVMGHLANGRGLIAWASAYANVDTLEQQTALTLDVGSAKLKAGSTWVQVSLYIQGLHDTTVRRTCLRSGLSFCVFCPRRKADAAFLELEQKDSPLSETRNVRQLFEVLRKLSGDPNLPNNSSKAGPPQISENISEILGRGKLEHG